jgi:predicted nucleic acid-binding protein
LLARFFAVPIELQTPERLYERALALAIELGLPATYDAQYLVVSQSLGATFWTADERLFNSTAWRLPFVHLIRDFPH